MASIPRSQSSLFLSADIHGKLHIISALGGNSFLTGKQNFDYFFRIVSLLVTWFPLCLPNPITDLLLATCFNWSRTNITLGSNYELINLISLYQHALMFLVYSEVQKWLVAFPITNQLSSEVALARFLLPESQSYPISIAFMICPSARPRKAPGNPSNRENPAG